MAGRLTTSHASRHRRWIAVTIWTGLITTAMVLWNGRTQAEVIGVTSEPVAFLLAAFIAFVSLFAWMLYNPPRGISAETPTLMLAGAATLFPPCLIGFCMIPIDSPLRFWLAGGLFVLLAIAVMSPVPDEFFAIPRDRHSYLEPTPFLNISHQSVLELNPDWLKTTDLSETVPVSSGPSLAPNAWRFQEDRPPSRSERRSRKDTDSAVDGTDAPHSAGRDSVSATTSQEKSGRSDASQSTQDFEPGNRRSRSAGIFPVRWPESRRKRAPYGQKSEDINDASLQRQQTSVTDADEEVIQLHERPFSRADADFESKYAADPFAAESVTGLSDEDISSEQTAIDGPDVTVTEADTLQVADRSQQQDFERIQDEFGGELVEGTMRIRFDQGQKRANLHIPFAPPLPGTPEVECESVDGETLRLKIPERHPWGIRIEARRTDTSGPLDAEIGFAALYVPTHR